MITYEKLKEKFIDKGYVLELQYFVLSPTPFQFGRILGTEEKQRKIYKEAIEKVYGADWEYWNIWIDYQKYK